MCIYREFEIVSREARFNSLHYTVAPLIWRNRLYALPVADDIVNPGWFTSWYPYVDQNFIAQLFDFNEK